MKEQQKTENQVARILRNYAFTYQDLLTRVDEKGRHGVAVKYIETRSDAAEGLKSLRIEFSTYGFSVCLDKIPRFFMISQPIPKMIEITTTDEMTPAEFAIFTDFAGRWRGCLCAVVEYLKSVPPPTTEPGGEGAASPAAAISAAAISAAAVVQAISRIKELTAELVQEILKTKELTAENRDLRAKLKKWEDVAGSN